MPSARMFIRVYVFLARPRWILTSKSTFGSKSSRVGDKCFLAGPQVDTMVQIK